MVDQVVIGFNDPHSAYHSADSIPPGGEDGIRVACSGGIGGREHPIVLPDALHTAHYVRASVPQCSRLCIRSRSAMHTPVDVTGIEPAKASLQNLGLPNLLSTHPTILFWLGNRRPSGGRTDALCWLGASDSRGARPEPPFV